MSDYEKLMIKLKLVELGQNQINIALLADQAGTRDALTASNASNEMLEMVRAEAAKYL